MELRHLDIAVVHKTPAWNPIRPNVAIAQGQTEARRDVAGLGASHLSDRIAIKKAKRNLKQNAEQYDCEFRIKEFQSPTFQHRVKILEGEYKKIPDSSGLAPSVEVFVETNDGRATIQGTPPLLSVGFTPSLGDSLQDALNKASSL